MLRGVAFGYLLAAMHVPLFAEALDIVLGRAIKPTLSSGKTDKFQILAEAGEYLQIRIEGNGALLRFTVRDPQDHPVDERVRTGGVRDPIIWFGIAERAGYYRFDVTSQELAGHSVVYSLVLTDQHPATDRDRLRTRAGSALNEGEQQEDRGDHQAAIQSLERSLLLSQQAHDGGLEAEACYQIAKAEFAAGRPRDAIPRFEQAETIWRAAHDVANEARALRGLGKLYGDTQQASKAIEALEKSLTIAQAAGDPAGQAEALRELGSVAGARSDYAKAQDQFERGLALAREAGDRRTEADIVNMLGVLHQNTGKNADALSGYQTALGLRRNIGDRAGVAQSTGNLGVFHRNLGDSRTAIGYYEESLAIRRQLANPQGIANSLENLAVAQADLGNFEKSVDLSREAVELFHNSQARRGEMFALINLGDVHSRMGEMDKALEFYGRARKVAAEVGDRRGEATVLLSVGAVQSSRKHLDEAAVSYQEALRISRESANQRELVHALFALAELGFLRGETRTAIARCGDALEANRQLEDRREEARILSLMGSATLETEPSQGVGMLQRALAVQQEISDTDQEALTRSRMARAAERAGDLPAARDHSLAALDLLESVRRNAPPEGPRISFQAYKLPFYQEAVEVLMAMHRRDPQDGFDAQALQVSERARARALLDQLAESKDLYGRASDRALAAEATRTLELLDTKTARLTRILSGRHTDEQTDAARREIGEIASRYEKLREQLRANCGACGGAVNPQPLSLAEIQRDALDDRSILLEYMLGPQRSYLWAVSNSTLHSYVLPSREEVGKLVRQAQAALAEPARTIPGESPDLRRARIARSQRQLERAAASLSEVLLPANLDLAAKSIFIAPDGPLYALPFAVLLPRSAASAVLPSASSLVLLRESRASRAHRVNSIVLFADPDYPEGSAALPRLRFSREEAERIAALAPGKKRLVLGPKARLAAARDPSLGEYSILHFAAHALVDENRSERSGIALSDGVFQLHDIDSLSLDAALVVLSACRTGAGKPIEGEGPISIARAFLYAGASGVVATLWDVNDRATEVFMTRFYEGLFRRNLSAAAALQFARASLRADAAWSHPYYWAGFVLAGFSPAFNW